MKETIFITGGSGFIGSNFIKEILNKYAVRVINYDALTYAGNPENLSDIENHKNYIFIKGDIRDKGKLDEAFNSYDIDGIINFAAESHVDRSILDAGPFIETNINGTMNLLELLKRFKIKKFIQVSTDEVYGSIEKGKFTEQSLIKPNSPYSASKASADLLAYSYYKTYNLPVMITRCSNNYGPYQFPEKLIPLMINNALENKKLPVYGDGMNVRDWIHVSDHCNAIFEVYNSGRFGEVYNIGADSEKPNINIIRFILNTLGKSEDLIEFVKDRAGHDRRYAIDSSKITKELNWQPKVSFEDGLRDTINWYLENKDWSDKIRSGEYLEYYNKQYNTRQ